jgi:hypothetical protein
MYFSQLPPSPRRRRGKEGDDISKIIPRRKNTLMLFIYEDGTVERVVEMQE